MKQINLDYEINPKPRWGFGKPVHREINDILSKGDEFYKKMLESFLQFKERLTKIDLEQQNDIEPAWNAGSIPGLDIISLYSFVSLFKPKTYLEIGSGNSTKFARRAIKDDNLQTNIISIDPQPRREIDAICDEIYRCPLEDVDLSVFDRLERNDIVFFDGSHRSFQNSDVTTFFIDILPRLKSGVLVEIHDIFLPFDYSPEWADKCYSEQYLLACYLLGKTNMFAIVLPNMYVSNKKELKTILGPIWQDIPATERHGGSFWLVIN
jgi:predicted O-methyltransferase YrrM